MAKRFVVPFASTGDKSVTPDATDPSGKISYSQGWPSAYQLPDTDPAYRPVGRQEMNGVLFDVTGAIAEIQSLGAPEWVAVGGLVPPYPINAIARHSDIVWQSLIANNSDEPGVGAGATSWKNSSADVAGRLIAVRRFTASALYTPTAGVGKIIVTVVGGGGAGGGVAATTAGQFAAGGGGAAGGHARALITSVGPITMTIGIGGVPVAGGVGGSGGATSFGSAVSATGGGGGGDGPAVTVVLARAGGTPGVGTVVTAGAVTPLLAYAGSRGNIGLCTSVSNLGAGDGGSSLVGGGGLGAGSAAVGVAAVTPGSGGGGAANSNANSARAGGAGAPGVIFVEEYV